MHVAIEAVGIKHSGGAVVLLDIVDALLANPDVSRVTVFASARGLRTFEFPQHQALALVDVPSAEGWFGRWWWLHGGLRRRLASTSVDVLLFANGVGVGPASIPSAAFVQQSLPYSAEALAASSWVTRLRMFFVYRATRTSCLNASMVMVQTPTMKRCIGEVFDVRPGAIDVFTPTARVEPAAQAPSIPEMEMVPPAARLLFVGSDSPHKNLECVIRAMPAIRAVHPKATLFLSLPADHPLTHAEGVIGLGYLSGDRLPAAYRMARMVVMPSLVETCGLPMIEALNIGTAVIAADRPYAHDMCRTAASFFDPLDPADFAAKAIELIDSDERCRAIVSAGNELLRERRADKPYARMAERLCALATEVPASDDAISWHTRIAARFDRRYADSSNFRERFEVWERLIRKYSRPSSRVLDAGCGSGIFSFCAAELNQQVLGVDGSSEMLALCAAKKAELHSANVEFAIGDVQDLRGIVEPPVDLILCSSVLEYVDDAPRALEHLASFLPPKGTIIVSMPNKQSFYRSVEEAAFALTGWPRYYRYVKQLSTLEDLEATLRGLGLEILWSEYYGRVPLVSAVLRRLGLRRHIDTLFVIAATRSR